jgi:hypothetical protein
VQIEDHEKMHLPKNTARKEMPKSRIQKKKPDCGYLKYIDIPEQEPNVSRNYSLLCLERTKKENNSLIVGIDKDEPPKISIIILNTPNMKKAMLLISTLNYFLNYIN